MNHCRTCKFWSQNPDQIGVGVCTSLSAGLRLLTDTFKTAQNFGCPCHESGQCEADLEPQATQLQTIREFLLDRYDIVLP